MPGRPLVSTPFEAHLMVVEPDGLLHRYVKAGCEPLIVHAEACTHLHRTLARIRELGARAAGADVFISGSWLFGQAGGLLAGTDRLRGLASRAQGADVAAVGAGR